MLKLTTSWDDGDVLDERLAKLLSHYSLKGTFYVTKDYRPERLSEEAIRRLADSHEVGAHTLTHPDLRTLSAEALRREIRGSKDWLEEITGREIKMFCYPKGLYDKAVIKAVRETEFAGARTTTSYSLASPTDPLQLKTTLQVYPFPFRLGGKGVSWRKILEPYRQRAAGLRILGVGTLSMYSWLGTACAAFDYAVKEGEVFHLWGHSWEIEKYGLWEQLERFFSHVKRSGEAIAVTNSELLG